MKLLGIAMALSKRIDATYGIRYEILSGEYELRRLEDTSEDECVAVIFYRYGYDDYKYDESLLKEAGWRIKDDGGAGYWMIKE